MPLTDSSLKSFKTIGDRYRKADGGGPFIEVSSTGSRVFRLAHRFGDKQRTLVVGAYPRTSLAQAR